MSAFNFPQLQGQTISIVNDIAINIPIDAGGAVIETPVIRNADNTTNYLEVPAGAWILTGYIAVNTDNALVTTISTIQAQILNFSDNLGNNGGIIAFGPVSYNITIPANTPTQFHQVNVPISCPVTSFYSLFLTMDNNNQIVNIPDGQASLYAQYLGPTSTNNLGS
jgi:hypothetical protein